MKTPLLATVSWAVCTIMIVPLTGSMEAAENPATEKGATKLIEKKDKDAKDRPVPPPVFQAPNGAPPPARTQQPAQPKFVYDQKPVTPPPPMVSQEQGQAIIRRFKEAYPELGSPRMVLYVNRALVDEKSGLKLIGRNERIVTGRKGEKTIAENRYRNDEEATPPLADRQTVREIELLFGRPLRLANVQLADQRLATQLMPSDQFQSLKLEGEQSRKDREALSKIADVAVEILIASKEVRVTGFDDVQVYAVPDIQATALRLKDAAILGQATSADLYGGEPSAVTARYYGVREITEATALALMEDMMKGVDAGAE